MMMILVMMMMMMMMYKRRAQAAVLCAVRYNVQVANPKLLRSPINTTLCFVLASRDIAAGGAGNRRCLAVFILPTKKRGASWSCELISQPHDSTLRCHQKWLACKQNCGIVQQTMFDCGRIIR